jgi:release factor glutamine methyltransferase
LTREKVAGGPKKAAAVSRRAIFRGQSVVRRYATDVTSISTALRDTSALLSNVSETPRLDAELLMAHALGMDRSSMLLKRAELAVPAEFANLVERRRAHEPVAYIIGRQAFWNLELVVTPDVLIPRADSETLVEAAINAFAGRDGPAQLLDLGTGSGALMLAALSAFPAATGIGIDASAPALGVAKDNAERLGFGGRTQWLHRNWREADWSDGLGRFELILCNPPYVETDAALALMVEEYEPHTALFAGAEGLDDYRILLPHIPALLAPGGKAIFEIGHTQADAVSDLAKNAGLSAELSHDLAGKPRALRFSLGIG